MMSTRDSNKATGLSNRKEFRQVLQKVVTTLRKELDVPGVSPFSAEELSYWFQQITTADIEAVWSETGQQGIHVVGAGH